MQLTQRNAIFSYYLNLDAEYNHLPFSLRTVFFWGGGWGLFYVPFALIRKNEGEKEKNKNEEQTNKKPATKTITTCN